MTDLIPADLPPARRAALAEVLGEGLATARALETLYRAFATAATMPTLARELLTLAVATTRVAEVLAPLATALGAEPGSGGPDEPVDGRASVSAASGAERAPLFARAFKGERALARACAEAVTLLDDAAVPALGGLAADLARDMARLRYLYLGYS
jgi:hypothetical protein